MYLNLYPQSNIVRTNCKYYETIIVQMFDCNKTITTTTTMQDSVSQIQSTGLNIITLFQR